MEERFMNREKVLVGISVMLLLYAVVSIAPNVHDAIFYPIDFQWDAAKLLTQKINIYEESLNATQYKYVYADYYMELSTEQFPSLFWMLAPLTLFPPVAANAIWFVINICSIALFLFLLRVQYAQHLTKIEYLFVCSVFISSGPVRYCLTLGQASIISLSLFLLSIWMIQKDKPVTAGILLAFSYYKITLIVPLAVYFIYKRWFKPFFISLIPHVMLTVFTACWLRISLLDAVALPIKVSARLTSAGILDIGSWFGEYLGSFSLLLELLLGIGVVIWLLNIKNCKDEDVFVFLSFFSLMITYHRFYDFVVLMIPLVYMLKNKSVDRYNNMLLWIVIAIAYYGKTVVDHVWGLESNADFLLKMILTIIYYIMMFSWIKNLYKKGERLNGNEVGV